MHVTPVRSLYLSFQQHSSPSSAVSAPPASAQIPVLPALHAEASTHQAQGHNNITMKSDILEASIMHILFTFIANRHSLSVSSLQPFKNKFSHFTQFCYLQLNPTKTRDLRFSTSKTTHARLNPHSTQDSRTSQKVKTSWIHHRQYTKF